MDKKIFNPLDWLEQSGQQKINTEPPEANQEITEIETIIQQIETKQIDIATAYSDWRDIGFALADGFGESGRDYFHRISKFYPAYSQNECETQYNNCLKANGQGITRCAVRRGGLFRQPWRGPFRLGRDAHRARHDRGRLRRGGCARL